MQISSICFIISFNKAGGFLFLFKRKSNLVVPFNIWLGISHNELSEKVMIIKRSQHLVSIKQIYKNKTRRGRSKRRNCLWKCFHIFKYVIDHANVCFFFQLNCLHCFMWLLLYYLLHLLRSLHSPHTFIAVHIFHLNIIWIYEFLKIHPQSEMFVM